MDDARPKSDDDPVPASQWWGMATLMTIILADLEFMVYISLAPLERGNHTRRGGVGTDWHRVRSCWIPRSDVCNSADVSVLSA